MLNLKLVNSDKLRELLEFAGFKLVVEDAVNLSGEKFSLWIHEKTGKHFFAMNY